MEHQLRKICESQSDWVDALEVPGGVVVQITNTDHGSASSVFVPNVCLEAIPGSNAYRIVADLEHLAKVAEIGALAGLKAAIAAQTTLEG